MMRFGRRAGASSKKTSTHANRILAFTCISPFQTREAIAVSSYALMASFHRSGYMILRKDGSETQRQTYFHRFMIHELDQ